MTSLYVDIARLRIAALEIVERRLAASIIEKVFDLSLESITFNCSYGYQPAICGRKAAGPESPGRDDKDTPTAFGFFHSHFACATALLGIVTGRQDGLCIQWRDLHQSDSEKMSFSFTVFSYEVSIKCRPQAVSPLDRPSCAVYTTLNEPSAKFAVMHNSFGDQPQGHQT
jgi:hypothetical protein